MNRKGLESTFGKNKKKNKHGKMSKTNKKGEEEELPEQLRGCDPKLIEMIENGMSERQSWIFFVFEHFCVQKLWIEVLLLDGMI